MDPLRIVVPNPYTRVGNTVSICGEREVAATVPQLLCCFHRHVVFFTVPGGRTGHLEDSPGPPLQAFPFLRKASWCYCTLQTTSSFKMQSQQGAFLSRGESHRGAHGSMHLLDGRCYPLGSVKKKSCSLPQHNH